MGIPKLNKWLLDKCSPTSIKKSHLTNLQDKRIAVDISIYLYRFLVDGHFMEQLYLFLATLRYYCIQPVIVFDGKAPLEKRATIQRRKTEKQDARAQYLLLEKELVHTEDPLLRQDIQKKMAALKKRMVRITWAYIDSAIELIKAFGFEYYLAPSEADQLCVHLALTDNVYAILSDDMDLLLTGAPRLLRGFSISTHEVTLYDTNAILVDMGMTLQDFRATVALSGTDYELNTPRPNMAIKRCFELYDEYRLENKGEQLIDWLGNKGIIEPVEYRHICGMFEHNETELSEFVNKNKPPPRKMRLAEIRAIMRMHKFIFPGHLATVEHTPGV
jgi:5'-3' exonuclease